MQHQLVILDRDGVINFDPNGYIKSPDEWHAIPGALTAIAALNQAGYIVAIASNQSGIGRGYFTLTDLDQIHQKISAELATVGGHVDGIFFCPHHPNDGCCCRKPKPGLLLQIAEYFNLSLSSAYFIGDSLKDMQAAIAVNATPLLVKTGNGLQTLTQLPQDNTVHIFENMCTACEAILKGNI